VVKKLLNLRLVEVLAVLHINHHPPWRSQKRYPLKHTGNANPKTP